MYHGISVCQHCELFRKCRNSKFDMAGLLPEVDMPATWPNSGQNVARVPGNQRSNGRNWLPAADQIVIFASRILWWAVAVFIFGIPAANDRWLTEAPQHVLDR